MWPDRVSNPGPLTYELGALPTTLRGPATLLQTKQGPEQSFRICAIPSGQMLSQYEEQSKLVHFKGEQHHHFYLSPLVKVGWLVVLGLTALSDSISVYIGPSPREREKENRNDRREKTISKQPPTRTYCNRSRPVPYSNPN